MLFLGANFECAVVVASCHHVTVAQSIVKKKKKKDIFNFIHLL